MCITGMWYSEGKTRQKGKETRAITRIRRALVVNLLVSNSSSSSSFFQCIRPGRQNQSTRIYWIITIVMFKQDEVVLLPFPESIRISSFTDIEKSI